MHIAFTSTQIIGILPTKQTLTLFSAQKSLSSIQERSYSILSRIVAGSNSKRAGIIPKALSASINPMVARKLKNTIRSSMVRKKSSNSSSSTSDEPSSSRIKDTLSSTIKSLESLTSLKLSGSNYFNNMRVIPLKALQDNYMYLLIDEATRHAAAVDPVNASAMAEAIYDQSAELKAILTTHHHYDHAHGNADLLEIFPDITVYGGDSRIQALTKSANHGDIIKLGNIRIECLSTPCHTKGHICYYATCYVEASDSGAGSAQNDPQQKQVDLHQERAVFTGDTLFIAGCGRFFEGTSEQMNHNLNVILGKLPSDTRVFCGHEYTVNNLEFALSVEPQNLDVKSKLNWAINKAARKEPTVPSTIGEEKKINPYMRLKLSSVKKYTGETEELKVMTVLRHRKNEFQP